MKLNSQGSSAPDSFDENFSERGGKKCPKKNNLRGKVHSRTDQNELISSENDIEKKEIA